MCYWFAETLGLHPAAGTLFNLIESYVPYGRVMARHLYDCRGFYFAIQTDVWGRVTPEAKGWSVWLGAAPWLGQHMFQHWRYTKDVDFLKNRCYPYLKECAAFYEDYLMEKDGELWILPSQSPENRFVGSGNWPVSIGINSAMDVELVTELLQSAIECAEILETDAELTAKWRDMLNRLPALTFDSRGRLNEWDTEREEVEPGHRHLSHIYGLYPSQLFEPDSDEWKASERSLDVRLSYGGGHTGWSRSWVACLMARLGRSEEAWEHFIHLIGDFATISLLDLCPPPIFQIDGNMGGTACVCEMLMQSRRGELRLLPALPSAWPRGRVEKFRAQDGLTVSFAWEDGRLTDCTLEASEAMEITVKSGDWTRKLALRPGINQITI
jgi:alpha-L-fucosidase 2